MDPQDLQKNNSSVNPGNLGSTVGDVKKTVDDQVSLRDKAAAQLVQSRKDKAARRVGIKTYRDYAADELKKGGGTLTKMIVQEREKEREQKRHSVKNSKNILISFLAVLFVAAGIGIVALSFIIVSDRQEAAAIKDGFLVVPQPLIQSDFQREIYIPSPTRSNLTRAIAKDIEETAIPIGDIKHIYVVQDGTDTPKELTTTQSLLAIIEAKVPSALTRALDPVFMYGTYSSAELSPFIIFTTSSFSTAYAGLLEWEKDIIRDLTPLFTDDLDGVSGNFQDVVLQNTDVRVVLDSRGEVLFGYGFLQDKETLVMFDNRNALREIITRSQRNTIKR